MLVMLLHHPPRHQESGISTRTLVYGGATTTTTCRVVFCQGERSKQPLFIGSSIQLLDFLGKKIVFTHKDYFSRIQNCL